MKLKAFYEYQEAMEKYAILASKILSNNFFWYNPFAHFRLRYLEKKLFAAEAKYIELSRKDEYQ